MAIFGVLEVESTLQVNDKTRLDATKTYLSKDEAALTLIEIQPEASTSFIDITPATESDADQYWLDWQYSSEGTKTVTLRITTDGSPVTVTKTITVLTSASDYLFSTDAQLVLHEPDILKWVRLGRSSFLDMHRAAQTKIIQWLDQKGFVDANGNKYTKTDIADVDEVNQWSTYLTLRLIFEGLSNAKDDIFDAKRKRYEELEIGARARAILRIDVDADGVVDADEQEGLTIYSGSLYRR